MLKERRGEEGEGGKRRSEELCYGYQIREGDGGAG